LIGSPKRGKELFWEKNRKGENFGTARLGGEKEEFEKNCPIWAVVIGISSGGILSLLFQNDRLGSGNLRFIFRWKRD
jgi:hypothetical protein